MRQSIDSTRPILAPSNSAIAAMNSQASQRLSTASVTPSLATTATANSLDHHHQTNAANAAAPAYKASSLLSGPPASTAVPSARSSTYKPAPSAQDVTLPPEMRHYALSLERMNTGTRRMKEEQRYTFSQEKLQKMQMLSLEARLQKGLDRRLVGQDAAAANGRVVDPEKRAL